MVLRVLACDKGFDLLCGAGRLGLQSAPGALLRALGFESLRYQNPKHPFGRSGFWHAIRDSNP